MERPGLKPEVEGRGGGYGRYQGLKLAEIQALFDKCVEDPSMRSISAVLRVTREQLDARGQLGIYPLFTWIAGAACLIGSALRSIGPQNLRELATKTALGAGTVFLLLIASTLPARHVRRTNLEQERLIRTMAVEALLKILEHNPVLKPLTVEQDMTVKILLKKTTDSEKLRTLL
jgi:hypothetical protein